MTPTTVAAPDQAGADERAQRKAKRNAAWMRWGGILVGFAAIVRVGAAFLPHGLADCDDSNLQSSLRSAIEARTNAKITSVSGIQTVSRADKTAVCRMRLAIADGSSANITYELDLIKGQTNFKVTNVQ